MYLYTWKLYWTGYRKIHQWNLSTSPDCNRDFLHSSQNDARIYLWNRDIDTN